MKKYFFIIILIWWHGYDLQAQFEIKAGVSFDPELFAGKTVHNPTTIIGGLGYQIPLSEKMSLKPEVLYTQYKSPYITRERVNDLQFPLTLNARISRKFDLHGGALVDRQSYSDTTSHETDVYIVLGSGFALSPRLKLQTRYVLRPVYGNFQVTLCYLTKYVIAKKSD